MTEISLNCKDREYRMWKCESSVLLGLLEMIFFFLGEVMAWVDNSLSQTKSVPKTNNLLYVLLYSQDILYTASVVLLLLLSFYGNTESKPTNPTSAIRQNSNVTKQTVTSQSAEEGSAQSLEGERTALEQGATTRDESEEGRSKRDTLSNPCVVGHKLKLIDRKMVVLTVICAEGCKEIKRVFFLKNRDVPLTFAVDCQK